MAVWLGNFVDQNTWQVGYDENGNAFYYMDGIPLNIPSTTILKDIEPVRDNWDGK